MHLLVAALLLGSAVSGPTPERLQTFDYQNVKLLDGRLEDQFEAVSAFYMSVPDDDLLKGFRAGAGLPAPGNDLSGWYTADVFHVFGQLLSAYAKLYRQTGDGAIRAKVVHLVDEWGKTIRDDGFFFYSDHPNAPHYIYDKMVGGLVDAAEYAGHRPALDYLARITDWAERNLDRTNGYGFNAGAGSTEWYTLSENLYRAYMLTGDERYRDFAKVWEYTDYWTRYADGRDIFDGYGGWYHAYSHVNTLSGAGAAYAATGDERYLRTIRNAYDYLRDTQCYATGGYGPGESLVPMGQLTRHWPDGYQFETMCGSWAAFKLTRYLTCFTGESRYGDWVERLLCNGVGAAIPPAPDGSVQYGSCYGLEPRTKHEMAPWSCCTGTYPSDIAEYCNLVYFHDVGGLYVSQFVPSEVLWNGPTGTVTLTQETRFPEEDRSTLRLAMRGAAHFPLHVRVPEWCKGLKVAVNGRTLVAAARPGAWATVERTWRNGDTVELSLPARLKLEPLPGCGEFPAVLVRGPVVLVRPIRDSSLPDEATKGSPESWLERSGPGLGFRTTGPEEPLFVPYYSLGEGEPYVMYFDRPGGRPVAPSLATYRLPGGGDWNSGGEMHYTAVVGSYLETTFVGNGVRWEFQLFDDAGIAEISIDNAVVDRVDLYNRERGVPAHWEKTGLRPGSHTLRIRATADKNPASSNTYINSLRVIALP